MTQKELDNFNKVFREFSFRLSHFFKVMTVDEIKSLNLPTGQEGQYLIIKLEDPK